MNTANCRRRIYSRISSNSSRLQKGCEWNFDDQLNVALKTDSKYFLKIMLKEIFDRYLPHEGGLRRKRYFLLFFSAQPNWPTHKISDWSDPPFMFFANNLSNIWHIWLNPNINHKHLAVLHHLRNERFSMKNYRKIIIYFENISNSLYWGFQKLLGTLWLTIRPPHCKFRSFGPTFKRAECPSMIRLRCTLQTL